MYHESPNCNNKMFEFDNMSFADNQEFQDFKDGPVIKAPNVIHVYKNSAKEREFVCY